MKLFFSSSAPRRRNHPVAFALATAAALLFATAPAIAAQDNDDATATAAAATAAATVTVAASQFETRAAESRHLIAADGYGWPNLYEEADDMLDASLLMYLFATLRSLAKDRPDELVDADVILKEPVTAVELERALTANLPAVKASIGPEEALRVDASIDAIVARHSEARARAGGGGDAPGRGMKRAVLEVFSDDNASEELVYAIAVDSAMKRVTVAFRGSVTTQDFLHDANIWLAQVPNPYANATKRQPKNLGIHNGFNDYLFYDDDVDDDGTVKQKYNAIEDEVAEIMSRHPGYKLYITGHSLGAALSSLFAFMISAREDIPKPVTCVSVASPFVGDGRWKRAFQFAESIGNLRYLRISNKRDLVTIVPFLSFRLRAYKHVGVNLRLYRNKPAKLIFPKVGPGFLANAWKRVWNASLLSNLSTKYLKNHGVDEYDARLEINRDRLMGMYLNDLYSDRAMVGFLKNLKEGNVAGEEL